MSFAWMFTPLSQTAISCSLSGRSARQLNVQFQTVNVENSAANAVINVNAGQDALNFNFGVPKH